MWIIVRFLQMCPLLLLGMVASAQTTTIPVRAGEHAEFTRLVIQIPDTNSWRVTTEDRKVHLIVDGPPLQFDLSQTFTRIPRTRLRDAVASASRLEFRLGCACEIRAYEDIPQFLIIDILGNGNPAAPPVTQTIRPRERPEDIIRPSTATRTDITRAGSDLARQMLGQLSDSDGISSLALWGREWSSQDADMTSATGTREKADTSGLTHSDMAQELGRIIAGSVAGGRLTPSQTLTPLPQDAGTERQPSPRIDQTAIAHLDLQSHNAGADRLQPNMETAEACVFLSGLDLETWSQRVAPQQANFGIEHLYGEFDKLDPDHGLDLVRHYLALGFGAEARLAATLLDLPAAMSEIIRAIAFALDLERVPAPNPLPRLRDCGSQGALWAFLGSDPDMPLAEFPIDPLIQAVDALPAHLRLHLGPEIISRLTKLGYINSAVSIESSLDRIVAEPSGSLRLAKIALALEQAPSAGAEALEQALSPDLSDDMLIFLLARKDAANEPVDIDLITLATSRRLVLRGDPRSGELTRLLARALARNGAFGEAFALAQTWDKGLEPDAAQKLMHYLVESLTDDPDDARFVTTVFEQKPWLLDKLSHQLIERLSSRMRDLGFERQAALIEQVKPYNEHMPLTDEFVARPELLVAQTTAGTAKPESSQMSLEQAADDIRRARLAQARLGERRVEEDDASVEPSDQNVLAAARDVMQRAPDPAPLPEDTPLPIADGSEPAQRNVLTDRPDEMPDGGLLANTRHMLEESATLRERLEAMLIKID